jgi:hypothetical protein
MEYKKTRAEILLGSVSPTLCRRKHQRGCRFLYEYPGEVVAKNIKTGESARCLYVCQLYLQRLPWREDRIPKRLLQCLDLGAYLDNQKES